MENKIATINEIIEYGLDTITKEQDIQIPIKDFIYLYKTIEELRRFFHQEKHYENPIDIKRFVGNMDEGMYSVLTKIYNQIFDNIISEDLEKIIESDELESPKYPFYYRGI